MEIQSSRTGGLSELAGRYDGILCDVWGVLHNGVAAWPGAIDALESFRRQGGSVVMITNAPRPRQPVKEQLRRLGVPGAAFDEVVTSGDVTRMLIGEMSPAVFHLGPERDLSLYHGTHVELVGREQAQTVVCTGLVDDTTETPDDYRDLLRELRERDLPFICANPDIVVERGDALVWCAGALARDYGALGGRTYIVGKPHRPIYEHALAQLGASAGREMAHDRVLAIGDGMPTDVAGASAFGLDLLYISAGIHAGDYAGENGNADEPDPVRLAAFLEAHDAHPIGWMPRLKW
ncbi:MAG: TIGR01459 family HAD-type hydrolase [Pseudomonadota bacterium]|nr:TIGR01459 family HAD-type hydrolase [Pseudomonadota bacterium]